MKVVLEVEIDEPEDHYANAVEHGHYFKMFLDYYFEDDDHRLEYAKEILGEVLDFPMQLITSIEEVG